MTKVSIFTPSYNKGAYVLDAISSVLSQTMTDWEMWIMENSTDDITKKVIAESGLLEDPRIVYEDVDISIYDRADVNMMGWLLNRYYPRANGEFVFFLSDDDIIDPDCLDIMSGFLDDRGADVCYASLRCYGCKGPGDFGPFPDSGIVAREVKRRQEIDGRVDGGQILHRKSCLDKISQPYFEEGREMSVARHIDGIFMERLAEHYYFYPIDKFLVTHRYNPLATFTPAGHGFTGCWTQT